MRRRDLTLYWRVCAINGAVFVVGALLLALSPARVSERILAEEAVVLGAGLVVIIVLNSLLLRYSLAPVDRVIRTMDAVHELPPGERLAEDGTGAGERLVRSYNAMLDRLEAERGRSSARALAAQEAERHRIAQELHDEVGQSLTVVLLMLKRLEADVPDDVRGDLGEVRETAREGLDDIRRVARRLRPGVLDDLGLQAALSALCTDVGNSTGIPVRRTVGRGLPQLPAETELVIYRVAQEALTNIIRHAHAETVTVSLTKVGDHIVLVIRDDGVGFAELHPGAGVSGMRERAMLVDAELDLESSPGRGTTVRLVVPL